MFVLCVQEACVFHALVNEPVISPEMDTQRVEFQNIVVLDCFLVFPNHFDPWVSFTGVTTAKKKIVVKAAQFVLICYHLHINS